jgi:hypothetical protein
MIIKKNTKEKIFLFFSFILIIFWLYPLWNLKNYGVIGDGNLYLAGIESVKTSLLDYSQWPQYSPWQKGGKPESLYLMSPISIRFWIFMVFETKSALSIYLIFCFIILFYGSYKVGKFFFKNNIYIYSFAFLSIFNIALIFHLKAGHYIFLSFCYFPLVLYFLFKYKKSKFSGIFAGYFYGLMLDDDIAYMSAYAMLILGILIIYFFINHKNECKKKILYWIYFFLLTSLCVVGYKLGIFYEISLENPRLSKSLYFSNIFSLVKSYLIPYYELIDAKFTGRRYCKSTWENSVYIGLIAFIFIFYSFKKNLSQIHYLIIFLFLLQLGTSSFLPYGILQKLPVFESHGCYNRVRIYNSFYLSILILVGYIFISKDKNLKIYKYKNYLLIFILVERFLTSHILMYGTHEKYENLKILSSRDANYKNYNILEKYRNNKDFFNYSVLPPFEAIQNKIGVVRTGGDSFLGYEYSYGDKNYNGVFAIDENEYLGEFILDDKNIEPDFWSPNLIIFNNLEIGKELKININPNRGWQIDGKDFFKNNKIWEPNKKFIVEVKSPTVILKYKAPGKARGVVISLTCFILLLISILKSRNKYNYFQT